VRYESKHRNVVARLPLPLFQRFEAQMKATGKSMGQLVREALDPALRDRRADYTKGWNDGSRKAADRYGVSTPCLECGGPLFVVAAEDKQLVSDLLARYRWAHKQCPTRAGPAAQ